MGWDYYTYIAQPIWFLEGLITFFNEKAEAERKAYEKNKR